MKDNRLFSRAFMILVVIVLICTLMTVFLTGCSKEEPTEEPPSPGPGPDPDPDPDPPPQPQPPTEAELLEALNTATATALSGKEANTAYDVLSILGVAAVDFTPINAALATSGHILGLNISTKAFVIIDTSKLDEITQKENIFVSVKNSTELATITGYGFSVYLLDNYATTEIAVQGVGLDVGTNAGITSITYTGATAAHSVIIRTNGGALTINAGNDTVKHYGTGSTLTITAIANESYDEYGAFSAATLTAGHIHVKESGYIGQITSESDQKITVDGAVMKVTGVAVEDASTGYVTDNNGEGVLGDAAEATFMFSSRSELLLFRDYVNAGSVGAGINVQLVANIDMSGYDWLSPIGTQENPFEGTFDGKNYRIINLSNNGAETEESMTNATSGTTGKIFGLFGYVQGDVNISNLDLTVFAAWNEGKCWAGLVAVSGYKTPKKQCTLLIENVTINGSLQGSDKVAGFLGQSPYDTGVTGTTTFINCVNNANVTAGNRAAGFLGGAGGSFITNKLTFTNCTNNGDITATNASGWAAGICSSVNQANSAGVALKAELSIDTLDELYTNWKTSTFDYTNCQNTGTISGAVAYTLFLDSGANSSGTGVYTYSYNNEAQSNSCGLYFAYLNCIGDIDGHGFDWKTKDDGGNPYYDVLWKGIPTAYVNIWDNTKARVVFTSLTAGTDYIQNGNDSDVIIINQYDGVYVYGYYSGQGGIW